MNRILALVLSAVFVASCGQQGSTPTVDHSSQIISQGGSEDGQPVAPVFQEFVAVKGEKEFSGRLVARPLQATSTAAVGLSPQELGNRQAKARADIAQYRVHVYVKQVDEYVFHVPARTTENDVAKKLMATGNFQYVEPDWILYPIGCPNDTHFSLQWNHNANRMRSCDAWGLHTGTNAVTVGICDTGVLTTHEDLAANRKEGYNAVDQKWESAGGNISPVHSHGTNSTGCAAANGNNGKGVAGVGWNLGHRMLRVSNVSSGSAASSVLRHAAMTAVENGDRVASVSYSGVDSASNLTTATYIKSRGGLLIWSAGNDNRDLTYGNRDSDDIIVVGATDSTDAKASFSAYGQFVDVVGPGVSVPTTSTSSNSSYVYASGTSFSCPLTAGVCAMIWSANPSLTPDQVEAMLKSACDDLGSTGVDNTFGYGRINTYNAVVLALGGSAPTADFTGTPTSGSSPLVVNYSDQSSGAPTSWAWNFGDNSTSTAQNPSHTYTTPGTYNVTLTATNSNGNDTEIKNGYIFVSGPLPTAEFSGTPTSGTSPLAVSFSDLSSGSPTSWSWNFGDSSTSTAQNPSHTYTTPGTYNVTLTATNAYGSDVEVKNGYISVNSPGNAPTAAFSGTPLTGTAPLLVSFTDQSTDTPTSWSWDFGDNSTSTAQNPSHTYNSVGSYTVTLTVTNAYGADGETKTNYVTVTSGGYTGEGFILSKNADFSTDDRTFSRSDTIYIRVWTDKVDNTSIRSMWWQLKKRKDKVRQNLTNNGDNSYTASFNLSGLPSSSTSWTFKAKVQDKSRVRFRPTAKIKVN